MYNADMDAKILTIQLHPDDELPRSPTEEEKTL
jgi:hypothetical protein